MKLTRHDLIPIGKANKPRRTIPNGHEPMPWTHIAPLLGWRSRHTMRKWRQSGLPLDQFLAEDRAGTERYRYFTDEERACIRHFRDKVGLTFVEIGEMIGRAAVSVRSEYHYMRKTDRL